MGRGFLQNFQQGVLRLLGHIVGPDEQNGAAGRLIGQDIGVLPHGPHGVDMKGPGRPVPAHLDDIRVAAGRGLDAAGADAARLVPRPLADGRFGQQAGQGAPAAPLRALQHEGVGKPPASISAASCRLAASLPAKPSNRILTASRTAQCR